MARFINHSCQPNCATEKWLIDGETSVCIFAMRDIAVGEELTYNYHLQWGGGKRVRCTLLADIWRADAHSLQACLAQGASLVPACISSSMLHTTVNIIKTVHLLLVAASHSALA